ncbi:MAG: hypothetical protein KGJ13_10310 [Patescibacteria group bacterium]|nr:hypothetical protein [Patescibacteria group bacterium]
MFSFNPVAWFESAINGKLEREAAIKLLGMGLSGMLTFLWSLGSIPVIGKALKLSAAAMKVNLDTSGLLDDLKGLQVTVPAPMYDADLRKIFQGEEIQIVRTK